VIGQVITHYRILEKLGGGGMGVVYKGRDTLLDRPVAIKVLSPELLADETAARGFIREAKAASALNHPNILTVHDLLEAEGVHFLVMEFVDGQTLRGRIGKKGMELRPLLDISLEVAEALAAAHKAGIVHRDLKPENIMVRTDGHIKVVDFGLAKLLPTRPRVLATGESTMLLPGVPLPAPGVGIEQTHIAGTLPYMSPEQLTGKPLDHRTDIYSFGVVLYEMATGQQPHQGRTTAEIVESILTKEPRPATDLSRVVPDKLQEIIGKTLEKDPADRYQHMEDVAVDLRKVKRVTDSGPRRIPPGPTVRRRRPSRGLWVTMAGAALLLALALVAFVVSRPLPPPKVLDMPRITDSGRAKGGCVVTDGSRVYFAEDVGGRYVLMQVPTEGGQAVPVLTDLQDAVVLAISPTGSELLVRSPASSLKEEAPLWVQPAQGGSPRRLGDLEGAEAAWSPNGESIVYTKDCDIYVAKSDGTESRKLQTVAVGTPEWPRWSPDGTRIRFTVSNYQTETWSLWEASAIRGEAHRLLPDWNQPADECCGDWTPDGKYYVFSAARNKATTNVWAIPEKADLLSPRGRGPMSVSTGPINAHEPVPSRDGKTLFVVGQNLAAELLRFDQGRRQFVAYLAGFSAWQVDFSRDGQWLAYVTRPKGTNREGVLWRSKVDGTEKLQLTAPPVAASMPRWSSDGKIIAFVDTAAGGPWKVCLVSAEGGSVKQPMMGDQDEASPDWSPDGASLVFGGVPGGCSGSRILTVQVVDLATKQVSKLPGSEGLYSPRWSPDGNYIAALRADSEKLVLFNVAAKKWTDLAELEVNYARWSRDGSSIYFDSLGRDRAIFRLRLRDGRAERIVSLSDFPRRALSFEDWFGLDPDDSPLVLRDLSTEEIYALKWEAP
jgi:Tol biopolymer transport system component